MIRTEDPSAGSAETLGQARVWEVIKMQYLGLGLDHRCAALAAWGHACGFTELDPPCHQCAPIVAAFDLDAGGQWRKASRGCLRAPSTLSLAFPWNSRHSTASDKFRPELGASA